MKRIALLAVTVLLLGACDNGVGLGTAQDNNNGNGKSKTNGQMPDKPDEAVVDVLIEQAEALKASLRDSLTKTNELVSALKRHRRQSKAVQSALVSLRRLQAVEV